MKSQRNSFVPLFVLAYMVTEVVEDVKDILVACKAAAVDKKNAYCMYSDWSGEASPSLMKPLQSSSF